MKEDKDLSWFDVECVPKDYILAKEDRPQNLYHLPVSDHANIPVIDLAISKAANGHIQLPAEEILTASQEFGIFQVINHGIPEKIVSDAMSVVKEFFDMASKDTTGIIPLKKGWVYASRSDHNSKDGVHLWRENLKQAVCHPLEDCIHLWPDKPTTYQEVTARYLVEIKKLSGKILELICEGLGLKQGYFKEKSEVQLMVSNYYPPCPDPNLTLGIPPHKDPTLITLLCQGGSAGLQILKDGQWINVGAIPNAIVVNIGNQLEVISNGKLKSVEHRVVTSKHESRLSIATLVNPTQDCIIKPAKEVVNELEQSHYTPIQYKEFVHSNKAFGDHTIAIMNALRAEN